MRKGYWGENRGSIRQGKLSTSDTFPFEGEVDLNDVVHGKK